VKDAKRRQIKHKFPSVSLSSQRIIVSIIVKSAYYYEIDRVLRET